MFEQPRDRSRSHHPTDHRHDDRRQHHPDLTKLRGWKAMQAEADLPAAVGPKNANGRCAWG